MTRQGHSIAQKMWFRVQDFVQGALRHAEAIAKFLNHPSEAERLSIPARSEK